jgi:hypothetical protein
MHGEGESQQPENRTVTGSEGFHGEPSQDAGLEPLLEEIRNKHGEALLAILVYGSWLRGKRDTMLDFYVLVEDYRTLDSAWQGWMCRALPPNVYHIHQQADDADLQGHSLRAKYAVLTLSRFHHAMRHDFHSYFWARFAQPCEVLYARDQATRDILTSAFNRAPATFVRRVLPAMEDKFSSGDLWARGLSLTYRSELRTESSNRGESIYDFNPGYYDRVTNSLALENTNFSYSGPDNVYFNHSSRLSRRLSPLIWWVRRVQGKVLSVLRLGKAAFTFNEPLEYLLWKIERHSGIFIEPTQRQLDHPLIFAWPLLWKLRRRGAFR